MSENRILVIDDDLESCKFLAELFEDLNWKVEWALSPENALNLFNKKKFDLVISDINLEAELNGIGLLRELKKANSHIPVILISGFGTLETAIQAVKEGAFDFISKPFKVQEIIDIAKRALEGLKQINQSQEVSKLLKHYESSQLIGRSPKMLELYNEIALVANARSTVLIIGDSGTGKELVARSLHNHSSRNHRPFIPINCGALTETLLESELFGHTKGSFTGAVLDKIGLFEAADGGTIFLDEIGETSLALQVKLLRVLQEGEIKPVGSNKTHCINVRVIAATNRDLLKEIKEGRFREDLFYRLSVVTLRTPSLKERPEDIPILTAHFLKKYYPEKEALAISQETLELMLSYDWPGNVRELENAIEHAAIYVKGNTILPKDLPHNIQIFIAKSIIRSPQENYILFNDLPSLDEMQKRYLAYVLEAVSGNRTKASEILKIDRRTLYRMAERFGMEMNEKDE